MLAQHLRRWPSIKTTLFQRLVFDGMASCLHWYLFVYSLRPGISELAGFPGRADDLCLATRDVACLPPRLLTPGPRTCGPWPAVNTSCYPRAREWSRCCPCPTPGHPPVSWWPGVEERPRGGGGAQKGQWSAVSCQSFSDFPVPHNLPLKAYL